MLSNMGQFHHGVTVWSRLCDADGMPINHHFSYLVVLLAFRVHFTATTSTGTPFIRQRSALERDKIASLAAMEIRTEPTYQLKKKMELVWTSSTPTASRFKMQTTMGEPILERACAECRRLVYLELNIDMNLE